MSSEKKPFQCCQTHKNLQQATQAHPQASSSEKASTLDQTKEQKSHCDQPNQIHSQKPFPMGPKTRITIHFDVGFPNALYLRGEGAELSWQKGLLLKNVKSDEWIWETTKPFTTCQFKILINDYEFEIGENHLLTCGASVHYTPKFH
ncbi:MAG: hypothetical protein H0W50_08020 [Parachlamydiaceae bacterium]|nr:hypothetical protein [Parachlamydiaceae bacterium]